MAFASRREKAWRLIPLPIAAGLVFQLGWGFLVDAFSKALRQRDWLNLALALVIAVACVRFGYVVGVIGGVICACLMFAAGYARVGVVRQHLSRAQFAGNVNRSTEASHYLSEAGEAIQIYWLSGYIFFGSSEGVFERARQDVRALPAGRVSHVILDLGMVSAADASATVSLAKLRNFCQRQGARLIFSSVAPRLRDVLARDGFFKGEDAHAPFVDVTAALAWAEDALLARSGLPTLADSANEAGMAVWLQQQLGTQARVADFMRTSSAAASSTGRRSVGRARRPTRSIWWPPGAWVSTSQWAAHRHCACDTSPRRPWSARWDSSAARCDRPPSRPKGRPPS